MRQKPGEKVKEILAIPLAVILLGGISSAPLIWVWLQKDKAINPTLFTVFYGVGLLVTIAVALVGHYGWPEID